MLARIKSHGFTVVELMVSIVLLGILSVSVFLIVTNFFFILTRNTVATDMTVDSQNLLRATAEELRYGAGVRQTNTITDPHSPSGGWNTSNTNFVIVIATPAIDASREYIIDTETGEPYQNELVYYKAGKTLFKRVLASPDATGNTLKTTCPASSASTACPADPKLIESVNDMVFTLYDQDNILTTDPLLARSLKITLSLQKDTFGNPLTLENSVQVTLRNTF